MAERFSTGLRNDLLKASGNSLADAMADGVIYLYSGSQPLTADATEGTATLLCKISESSNTYNPATAANGLNLDVAASGIVAKSTSETWSGTNLATGTVGWGRFYAIDSGATETGASTTYRRFDFSVGTSGADVNGGNTSLTVGETTTISAFTVTFPAS